MPFPGFSGLHAAACNLCSLCGLRVAAFGSGSVGVGSSGLDTSDQGGQGPQELMCMGSGLNNRLIMSSDGALDGAVDEHSGNGCKPCPQAVRDVNHGWWCWLLTPLLQEADERELWAGCWDNLIC